MSRTRLGVGIAGVAVATLFVPALASATPSPSPVRESNSTVSSVASSTVPAASDSRKRPKCSYPPHRAELSISPGDKTYRHPTRVAFSGQLHRGKCGVKGERVKLYAGTRKVGTDTTDRSGGWGITVRVQRTTRYYALSSDPDAQSRTVKITIRKHDDHHHDHH